MAVFTQETTYKNLELPDVVYKYRFWDNSHQHHKSILTRQEVFFASPLTFEDTKDCKILTRYDLLTNDEVYSRYLSDSYESNSTYTPTQHKAFADHWFKISPLRDKVGVKNFMDKKFVELCNHFGVLSLTEKNALPEMWDKYSGGHSGLCVGFNSKIMFESIGGGGKVQYYEELPIIHPTPKHSFLEQITIQVYSKEEKWEFEQEYRTHKLFPVKYATVEDRTIKLPKEAIREVILGALMPQKERTEVKKIIEAELPHVVIKQEVINADGSITIN
jgi:hypothetical protein